MIAERVRRGAAPAVVGLLVVTAFSLARSAFVSWPSAVIAALALVAAVRTRLHPILILVGGGVLGWLSSVVAPLRP